jgi:hypothetical protein
MARITSRAILTLLRNELRSRGFSVRKMERMLGEAFRHKLRQGSERMITVEVLLQVLDLAGIDKVSFFARLAGLGGLTLTVFGQPKKDHWTLQQRKILKRVSGVKERGDGGYAEIRSELRRIELLRDSDPSATEEAAWRLLNTYRAPGALVGALAVLAVEAPRPNAYRLFSMAFELLGPNLRTAAGGKLATAMGRNLFMSGHYTEALQVFETHALPVVALFGSQEEHALLAYLIGKCASSARDFPTSRVAFEKTLEIGSERLRFATLQHLAAEELNGGNLQRAVAMYEELVAMPYFGQAENRARAFVTWSRLTAKFLAGQLTSSVEPEFRAAVEQARILDPRSQVAAVLDLALFLTSIGKAQAAADLLKAEQWNVLGLEDGEILRKFVSLWETLGLPQQTWEHGCLAGRRPAASSLILQGVSCRRAEAQKVEQ